jgi:TonB family protein
LNALVSSPVLSWLLSYLFNALWQIPLVYAAAWVAARMLRRSNPRVEHRAWVGALLLQIALPACSLRLDTLWYALLSFIPATGAVRVGGIHVVFGPATAAGSTLRLPFAFQAVIALAYGCSLLYFAGRIAWGLFETRTLARSATRLTLTGNTALRWSQYCHRFGITSPPPEIAASPQAIGPVIGPVTVGLRRGLLLLPSDFLENIAPDDLGAVLVHELAHIQRQDFAKNLLYSLLSLPVAWHPLLWRTRARVAESRELVCDAIAADAIAAEAVAGRKQYAQSLLRIATMLSGRPPVPALHAIGILSLGSDASTFERRIMTLTHKPIPMSTPHRFVIAAACSVVALATCTSALALHTDVAALAPVTETAAPKPLHVQSGIMTGQKISGDNPQYPKEARAKKIQGAVVLDVIIGKDGAVENIRVQKTPDESLAKSALDAVHTWRYRPYLLNGEPVEVETTVNVIYNLEG